MKKWEYITVGLGSVAALITIWQASKNGATATNAAGIASERAAATVPQPIGAGGVILPDGSVVPPYNGLPAGSTGAPPATPANSPITGTSGGAGSSASSGCSGSCGDCDGCVAPATMSQTDTTSSYNNLLSAIMQGGSF